MAPPRLGVLVAVVAAGALAAGCGSGGASTSAKAHQRLTHAPRVERHSGGATGGSGGAAPGFQLPTIPAPSPTGRPADPAAVRVIRAWSSALRHGEVRAAARDFALPSVFVNGTDAGGGVPVIVIRTEREADEINAALPCGAVFLSADQRGQYVNALFRLTGRPGPGGGCASGAGETARTNFVVMGGRIVQWIRAPDDPGDNPGSGAQPQIPSPSAPQGTGPVI
jgi:hypothetical protein